MLDGLTGMREIDREILSKKDEIDALLARIKILDEEIKTLKKANAILTGKAESEITIGDAVEQILQKAANPLHVNELLTELANYGLSPKLKTTTSVLRNDRRSRFIEIEKQIFKLNENPLPTTILYASQRNKKVRGLTAAMRRAMQAIGTREFSVSDIVQEIANQDSKLGKILKENNASVSATLKRMANFGELEVMSHGSGSRSNTYKVRTLKEDVTY